MKAQAMLDSIRTRVASNPPAITPVRPACGVAARARLKARAAGDEPLSGVHEPVKLVRGDQMLGDKRLKHAASPVRISPVPPEPAVARARQTGARRAVIASGGALALAAFAALVARRPERARGP